MYLLFIHGESSLQDISKLIYIKMEKKPILGYQQFHLLPDKIINHLPVPMCIEMDNTVEDCQRLQGNMIAEIELKCIRMLICFTDKVAVEFGLQLLDLFLKRVGESLKPFLPAVVTLHSIIRDNIDHRPDMWIGDYVGKDQAGRIGEAGNFFNLKTILSFSENEAILHPPFILEVVIATGGKV